MTNKINIKKRIYINLIMLIAGIIFMWYDTVVTVFYMAAILTFSSFILFLVDFLFIGKIKEPVLRKLFSILINAAKFILLYIIVFSLIFFNRGNNILMFSGILIFLILIYPSILFYMDWKKFNSEYNKS